MKYLVIIPARGGSKGIPHKNIYPVVGKPLLEYTIECIKKVDFIGDVAVSTDDEDIANVARKYKNIYIIKRPVELALDTSSTEDALIHAIEYMKKNFDKDYDAVITLQDTSPLRKPETIKRFLMEFENNINTYDAYLTLTEDRSDFWIKNEDGSFARRDPSAPRRRQDRKPLYVENSAIYVTKTGSLLKYHSVLGSRVNGFVISPIESVDINEYIDIFLVEAILKKEGIQK